jgi:hypothetical protein
MSKAYNNVVKLNNIVSVRDYGAKGNGVADDTAAIQAAINSLGAQGGVVEFPIGTYRCTSELNPGTIPVILRGQGWTTLVNDPFGNANWLAPNAIKGTVLKFENTSGAAININGTNYRDFSIENIALLGPGSGTTVAIILGSLTTSALRVQTYNVFICNFFTGIDFHTTLDNTLYHTYVWGCSTGFLFNPLTGGLTSMTFVRTDIQSCAVAIDGQAGAGMRFYGGLFQNNTIAVKLAPAAAGGLVGWTFDGFWYENNDGGAIVLNSNLNSLQSITFSNSFNAAATDPISISGSQLIVLLKFDGYQAAGVAVTFPSTVINSLVQNCKFDGITNNAGSLNIISTQNSGVETTAFHKMRVYADGNTAINNAVLLTSTTTGFLYLPTCAGPPIGTPTTLTGGAPAIVDTANNKLYFYSSGVWRDAGP